jgi:glycosyltransferase involved in cell wall biosynthesis
MTTAIPLSIVDLKDQEEITLSVIIPVHNAGPFLKKAVESLLKETLPGLEILVIDDGSTDGGVESITGLPVRVLRQEQKGEAGARNAGVKAAKSRFVTFLDADDVMVSGALLSRLNYLSAHPEERVVGGLPSRIIDKGGSVAAEVFDRMSAKFHFPFRLNDLFYREGNFFPVSCSLYIYRREVFNLIGLYDETLPVAPDCDFHFRLLKTLEIPILPIPVFDRRIHESNLSLVAAGDKNFSFRPEISKTVREINRRHGFDFEEIVPWEQEYL